jgi:protease-4
MSDTTDPQPHQPIPEPTPSASESPPSVTQPPLVIPVRYAVPQQAHPGRRGSSVFGAMVGTLLAVFILMSIGILFIFVMAGGLSNGGSEGGSGNVQERLVSGAADTKQKIAVIKLDGVIMEGTTNFTQKEIDKAAADENVKAVVLRINSPGGTITASDDLYRRLDELARGQNPKQKGGPKKVVASMGSLAASGGYYVAMPAEYVMAEQTTITGSIGVYAAFPNIAELAKTYGVSMNVIKSDAMKDSGSMFHVMSAQERQLWQDMVDNAYQRFLTVIAENRTRGAVRKLVDASQLQATQSFNTGGLLALSESASNQREKARKEKVEDYKKLLQKQIPETEREIPDRDAQGKEILVDGKIKMVPYFRKRADGGIFMADEALKFGLIDGIGYQEDAVRKAAELAGLLGEYKVVGYERPPTLSSLLFGAQSKPLDAAKLAEGAAPRLWYLAPQAELAGILTAIGRN